MKSAKAMDVEREERRQVSGYKEVQALFSSRSSGCFGGSPFWSLASSSCSTLQTVVLKKTEFRLHPSIVDCSFVSTARCVLANSISENGTTVEDIFIYSLQNRCFLLPAHESIIICYKSMRG